MIKSDDTGYSSMQQLTRRIFNRKNKSNQIQTGEEKKDAQKFAFQ